MIGRGVSAGSQGVASHRRRRNRPSKSFFNAHCKGPAMPPALPTEPQGLDMKTIQPLTDRSIGTLADQQREFTYEGAPPPGVVGTDLPRPADAEQRSSRPPLRRAILSLKRPRVAREPGPG